MKTKLFINVLIILATVFYTTLSTAPAERTKTQSNQGRLEISQNEEKLIAELKVQMAKVRGKPEYIVGEPIPGGGVALGAMDSDSKKRCDLIEVLEKLRSKKAIPLLIDSLSDPQKSVLMISPQGKVYYHPVRNSAWLALKNITGVDFRLDKTKWQEWWNKNKDKLM